MSKKILVVLLALMMVVGVFACKPAATTEAAAPAEEGAKTYKAAFITQALSNESQAYSWKQLQQYAPEYGFVITSYSIHYTKLYDRLYVSAVASKHMNLNRNNFV